jgi:phosphoribosylamine---glycine ligase
LRVLLIGSGGREHALATALKRDSSLTELNVAPGNPGIEKIATIHPIDTSNNEAVINLANELKIDLIVVGPEAPLVNGLADETAEANIPCFGPTKAAAHLEGSKDFAKKIMNEAGVPTAQSFTCTNQNEIERALDTFGAPYVVKHDGLAAGKGVVVTSDRDEALAHAILSPRVVIEEFLDGPELSLFGISDGQYVLPMQPAQDFKRAYDGDKGLNTGGMGAYSPLPWAPANIEAEVLEKVLQPTIDAMAKRGTPFVGLLYTGLAITSKGIRVIEFNARFGDPETQVLLPRLKTPLAQLLLAAATKKLSLHKTLDWSDDAAVTVVLASDGYPADPKINLPITGLNEIPNTFIYHAGTKRVDGVLHSSGGRVLTVTGTGATLSDARNNAYQVISGITLAGSHYRSDIALAASQLGKS